MAKREQRGKASQRNINTAMKKLRKLPRWQRVIVMAFAVVVLAFTVNETFELGILPSFHDMEIALGLEQPVFVSESETQVHIVDVGQGGCTLIKQGDVTVLIDAGEKAQGDSVVNYLEKQDVEKIDYLVITHMHTDHMGGMQKVMESFPVGIVILPDMSLVPTPTATSVLGLLQTINEANCKVVTAKRGDIYKAGTGTLEIVTAGIESDNQNNNSVGILFTVQSFSFLTTGDGEGNYEKELLQNVNLQPVTLFAAGHHGSNTSNTIELIEVIKPTYVTISCSADNDYGHPHKEPLERFGEAKAVLYRTDKVGTIVFYLDENGNVQVATERGA